MYKYFLFSFYLLFNVIFSETITGYQLAKMIDAKNQPQSSKSEISMTLVNLKKDRKKIKEIQNGSNFYYSVSCNWFVCFEF